MKKALALLLGTALVGLCAQAVPGATLGIGSWGPPRGPEGGVIAAIAVDPKHPAILYAGALAGGFFKSTDAGTTWRPLDVDPTAAVRGALAVDPRNPRVVYAGSGHGVFKSTDSGATWRSASTGLFRKPREPREWRLAEGWVTRLAIDPRRSSTIYAATYGGLFKSINGGRTWRPANAGLTVTIRSRTVPRLVEALAIDRSDPSTIYAATAVFGDFRIGLFKSTDGGRLWRAVSAGLPRESIHALAVDPRRPGTVYAGTRSGIFKSVDAGSTWIELGLKARGTTAIAFAPGNPQTIYIAASDGIYRSTDGGGSWESKSEGLARPSDVVALAVDPHNPATVYLATASGVQKSIDWGRTWQAVNSGLSATLVSSLALAPGRPSTIYSATVCSGAFRTRDGGASWQSLGNGLPKKPVAAFAVDPRDGGIAYAAVRGEGIFKSTDTGATWRALGLRGEDVTTIAIDPQNSRILYAGTGFASDNEPSGAVWKSVDGGETWVDTGLSWPPAPNVLEPRRPPVTALALDPRQPLRVYAGTTRGVFTSTDGGLSWKLTSAGLTGWSFDLGVRALTLDPAEPETLYVATYAGVFRSTNGGQEWETATTGLPNRRYVAALAVNPSRPGEIYSGTYGERGGVFVSTDRGRTWQSFSRGLQGHAVLALAIDPNGRSLYAGTQGRGVLDFTVRE
jgi:photosystem II stability/assembly factor-like uncharacterized protein